MGILLAQAKENKISNLRRTDDHIVQVNDQEQAIRLTKSIICRYGKSIYYVVERPLFVGGKNQGIVPILGVLTKADNDQLVYKAEITKGKNRLLKIVDTSLRGQPDASQVQAIEQKGTHYEKVRWFKN